MSDWGFIVDKILTFLEANPDMRSLERQLFEWILNQLHPITGNHGRTCRGAIDCLIGDFSATWAPTVAMIRKLPKEAQSIDPSLTTAPKPEFESQELAKPLPAGGKSGRGR